MKTLIVSDIHGKYIQYTRLLDQLDGDGYTIGHNIKLIVNGDMVDRGEDSYNVIVKTKQLQDKYGEDNVVVLKGNHEEMLLDWLDKGYMDYVCGYGANTVKSIVDGLGNIVDEEPPPYWELNLERKYVLKYFHEYITWLSQLPTYYESEEIIVVHAGVKGKPEHWSHNRDSIHTWGRDTHKVIHNTTEKPIICGHTPTRNYHGTDNIYYASNEVIYIDGGVSMGGQLNGVLMNGRHVEKVYKVK